MTRNLVLTMSCVALLALSGCAAHDLLGGAADPAHAVAPGETAFRTDSSVYHVRTGAAGAEVRIAATFTNGSGRPLYVPTCRSPHGPVLERLEGGRWVTVFTYPVLLCLGPPLVIEPGATHTLEFPVRSAAPAGSRPPFAFSVPGTFRLNWGVYGAWSESGPRHGDLLPEAQRTSNSFTIRE